VHHCDEKKRCTPAAHITALAEVAELAALAAAQLCETVEDPVESSTPSFHRRFIIGSAMFILGSASGATQLHR